MPKGEFAVKNFVVFKNIKVLSHVLCKSRMHDETKNIFYRKIGIALSGICTFRSSIKDSITLCTDLEHKVNNVDYEWHVCQLCYLLRL